MTIIFTATTFENSGLSSYYIGLVASMSNYIETSTVKKCNMLFFLNELYTPEMSYRVHQPLNEYPVPCFTIAQTAPHTRFVLNIVSLVDFVPKVFPHLAPLAGRLRQLTLRHHTQ